MNSIAKLVNDYYIVTRIGDYPCTGEQATNVFKLITANKKGMANVNGSYISLHSIDAVLKQSDYEELLHKRRGDWKCKWAFWHSRGENCAHNREMYLREQERHKIEKAQNKSTTPRLAD